MNDTKLRPVFPLSLQKFSAFVNYAFAARAKLYQLLWHPAITKCHGAEKNVRYSVSSL